MDSLEGRVIALEQRSSAHLDSDEKFQQREENFHRDIKDNHLAHIQTATGAQAIDIAVLKTDVSWIKKWLWLIISSGLVAALTGIVQLIVLFINHFHF